MRRFAPLGSTVLTLFAGLVCATGCSKIDVDIEQSANDPFEVQINVTSDPGVPLPGAELLSGTKVIGKTDAAGSARVRFGGREGDQAELNVHCPSDYESPATPIVVALRRLAKGSQLPRFEARCPPALRTFVVGLRAEKGPNLPVLYMGRPVARTDASGAALFTAQIKPAEQVEITLNTAEKGSEQLRPQNPTLTFVTKDHDDFIVLDQTFTVEKKPVVYVPPKVTHRPTPLNATE